MIEFLFRVEAIYPVHDPTALRDTRVKSLIQYAMKVYRGGWPCLLIGQAHMILDPCTYVEMYVLANQYCVQQGVL